MKKIYILIGFILTVSLFYMNYDLSKIISENKNYFINLQLKNKGRNKTLANRSYKCILKDLYNVPFTEIEDINLNNKDRCLNIRIKHKDSLDNFIKYEAIKNTFSNSNNYRIEKLVVSNEGIFMDIMFQINP
ncbi:hypothetical protein ACER0A_007505 [Haloimpatiens sp. FM7315]|uniref:hypothetical protein n=1 Tax=Haloimpatiens sp. FM7315 TaxID=3298609 RepID=UPI0035A3C9B3